MESDGARHEGRAIRGLEIAPCVVPRNGKTQVWSLPKCMEGRIASVEEEVASYEDVKRMEPHLAQYCDNFPPQKQWKTIILLGRDCPWAMRQTTVNNPEKDMDLIVAETPLGWTLTGPKPTVNPPTKGQRVESKVKRVTRTNLSPSKLGLPKGLPLARVIKPKPGSPAELAGIENNDMMMSVGSISATSEKVEGVWPVAEELRRFKDRNVSVKVMRRGHARTLTLRPATWKGQDLGGMTYNEFRYLNVLMDSGSDKPKSIMNGSSSAQENSVRLKDGGYADGSEVRQPVVSQPGSGKIKGGQEYGLTFDFNKQTEAERKDASIKEVKTARALYGFGAHGDAGGTLSFNAGEDV